MCSLLLVSDYLSGVVRVVPDRVTLEVVDPFVDKVIARRDTTERTFAVTLRCEFQDRLCHTCGE